MSEIFRTPTDYICGDCGAEDHDRAAYEKSPEALVCHNCKAGRGMKIHEQIVAGVGMLPKKAVVN